MELTLNEFSQLTKEISSKIKSKCNIYEDTNGNLCIENDKAFLMTGNADVFYKEFDIEMKKQVAKLTQENNGK